MFSSLFPFLFSPVRWWPTDSEFHCLMGGSCLVREQKLLM